MFLYVNAFLIPLFGLTSIETVYSYFVSTSVTKIEIQAIKTTDFFIKFLAGLSLFSNTLQWLDLPH